MGKKGYNPFEKQSSTVSANELLRLMLANDFKVAVLAVPIAENSVRRAYRSDVMKAFAKFGRSADVSITGRSVHMEGRHLTTGQLVTGIRVPLFGMLGHGERDALYKLTGIPALNPVQERQVA